MTVVVRDQRLARYAYDKLDLTVGAAMTKSRDWWARRLGAATLSTGVGGNALIGRDGQLLIGRDGQQLVGRAAA